MTSSHLWGREHRAGCTSSPAQPSSQHIRACWKEPCEHPTGAAQPLPGAGCLCCSPSQPGSRLGAPGTRELPRESLPASPTWLCAPHNGFGHIFSPKGVFFPWERQCFQQGPLAEGWVGVSALGAGTDGSFAGRCQSLGSTVSPEHPHPQRGGLWAPARRPPTLP